MRRPAQRNRVMGEINITPLTDVMMVLLIIFMVTTPLIMKASIDINLPKAHVKKAAVTENLNVMLTTDGKIYVNGAIVKLSMLGVYLKDKIKASGDPTVTVAADLKVPYGDAVRVLDVARQAGAQKLVLAADPLPVKPLSEEILSK